MGIRPDLVGRGYGKQYAIATLKHAERHAKEHAESKYGTQRFRVTIAGFNQRAQSLWKQLGFRQARLFTQANSKEPFVIMTRDVSNHLTADWFARPSPTVAKDLIGCVLVRQIGSEIVRGQIVETEAYEAGDPAMYAYQIKSDRNAVVFEAAGIAYVYRIYRQYHCFNIVTDRDGFASTILIRAVDLEQRPSWIDPHKEKLARVAAGPGKLCRTLKIDESLKGLPIHPDSGIWVEAKSQTIAEEESPAVQKSLFEQPTAITQTTRIGLTKGADIPWRWYLTDSPAVSRKK